jgi:hypothetical protein
MEAYGLPTLTRLHIRSPILKTLYCIDDTTSPIWGRPGNLVPQYIGLQEVVDLYCGGGYGQPTYPKYINKIGTLQVAAGAGYAPPTAAVSKPAGATRTASTLFGQ